MPFSTASRASENGANPRIRNSGTKDAIYTIIPSARRPDGKLPFSGWGGARNRADRTSDGLTAKQVEHIIAAAQTAWRIGFPFNCHVTIHWEKMGVTDDRAAAATGALLTLVRDWLRKQGLPFAYAYVRENGDGKGSHVHILAHLPPGARWGYQRSRRWLEGITERPYRQGAIETRRVRGTIGGRVVLPDLYAENLGVVVGYVAKGAPQEFLGAMGIIRAHEPGGRIIGKRVGWSQNIGR